MKEESFFELVIKSIGGVLFLPFWYLERLLPRKKKSWIFGSWFGLRYSDNSRAIYEYVLTNHPDIKAVWITKDRAVYKRLKSEGKPVEYYNSIRGILLSLNAGAVFITTSPKDTNALCLNGAFAVWLWHGVGLKCIMADEKRFKWAHYSRFKKIKVWINKVLFPYENSPGKDAILNTGDFFSRFFMSGFQVDENRIWVEGYPRNDMLFSEKSDEAAVILRKKFPTATFIIYMPTHRINARKNSPFNGFEGFGFDREYFFEILEKGDYVFLNKGHFYDQTASIEIKNERFINITDNDYDDLYLFIKEMDILITDFSSIYFDFLLLKKPIILAPFDYDDYVSLERPLQFDYYEQEGVRTDNWQELLDVLDKRSYYVPSSKTVQKFHKYIDGKSCSRIVDRTKKSLGI
ncbi:MAG TPA: CDP-glycerol glycerophosphotransferase family protein [Bacteroidaceae bacterium]|nr:CDP-glycerol glycerophosphotransferase family protein [Bacteroidaceae bacterium]